MRTLTLTIFAFVMLLFGGVQSVGAYACAGWECYDYNCDENGCSSTCTGTPAGCSDNPTCNLTGDCESEVSCGPGYYACNRVCCDVGGGEACECGVRADGKCRSCGGGENSCEWSQVNCGPNQVVDKSNVISSICARISYCPGPGTAQAIAGCCQERGGRTTCGDWYYCPTRNNPSKMCRDCETEETYCVANTIVTYGCRSVCNSTAPSNLTVTQGASASTANVAWRSGTGGVSQRIYVGTSQAAVNSGCKSGTCIVNAVMTPFSANTNYTYPPVTGLATNTTYYFRVVTYESSGCTPGVSTTYTTPAVTLSGRVYLDTNNNCGTTPWNLGGLTVSVRGTAYSGNVGSDGRFGFYGGDTNPISYLDLENIPATYVPSTAAGCNQGATLTTVSNPSSTNYFYLTPYREAWWQAVGGSVYAGGSVRSELPSGSEALIVPGAGGALGALMRASGSLDTGAGEVSAEGYSAVTAYRGRTMNYDYFAAHMGVTPSTVNYWAADTMNKPANDPERVFYYQNPSGSEASVTSPWTVAAGESYVVFVNGDLRIAADVVVEEGGFLAYIVNGDVRVSPAVTDVAGLFVVDGVLSTETNATVDVPVEFQGSVVVWGGINFGRDLITGNVSQASETFVYRPDLLVNMPEAMKVFALRWEEVVPGTIGQ